MSGKGSALVKQLLIVSLSMVAILAACLSVQRYCNVVVHCTNATRASQIDSIRYAWLQQPTTDEMAYAIFGTGVAVGRQADSRYLDYIRTQINGGHGMIVDKKLKGRRDGFFIECGAADGHSHSNTLFLETERNWTGLLIEANQRYFKTILGLNRQAHVYGGCLSPRRHPTRLPFKAAGDQGGLQSLLTKTFEADIKNMKSLESTYYVQCYPLNDLLAALGVSHVDYFSLDVQGAEPAILKTVDFAAVRIDVIIMEVSDKIPGVKRKMMQNMRRLFNRTGLYREGYVPGNNDMMFERIDLA